MFFLSFLLLFFSVFSEVICTKLEGVVPEAEFLGECISKCLGLGTTPSAPLRMLRNISLVASTPPNLGGDTLADHTFTGVIWDRFAHEEGWC